jgi:hypothetical protein
MTVRIETSVDEIRIIQESYGGSTTIALTDPQAVRFTELLQIVVRERALDRAYDAVLVDATTLPADIKERGK